MKHQAKVQKLNNRRTQRKFMRMMKRAALVAAIAVATAAQAQTPEWLRVKPVITPVLIKEEPKTITVIKSENGRCWAWDDQRSLKCNRKEAK